MISKHSAITIARKAGIKSISENGIEKVREVVDEKIKTISERLSTFYSCKRGKTITKKDVINFLETEGIRMV
jgi:histone H3/H4